MNQLFDQTPITIDAHSLLKSGHTLSQLEDSIPDTLYASVVSCPNKFRGLRKSFIPVDQLCVIEPSRKITYDNHVGFFGGFDFESLGSGHPNVSFPFITQTEFEPRIKVENIFLPKSKRNQLVSRIAHKLKKSLSQIPDFSVGLLEDDIEEVGENIISELIRLNFEDIVISATFERSISSSFNADGFNIYYEYFPKLIEDTENDDVDVVINVFKDKKIISNWGGAIKDSYTVLQSLRNRSEF